MIIFKITDMDKAKMMSANGMIGVPVGDKGAIYRYGRIDVTISGNTIKAVVPRL